MNVAFSKIGEYYPLNSHIISEILFHSLKRFIAGINQLWGNILELMKKWIYDPE